MWQTDWADKAGQEQNTAAQVSALPLADVRLVASLLWTEHCIECALPDCYQTCPLYVARRDRKCARLKKGIVPNYASPGLFPYGAEVQFRRWGKLEAQLNTGAVSPHLLRGIDRFDRSVLSAVGATSRLLKRLSPNWRVSGAYAVAREWALRFFPRKSALEFDEFVIEVDNKGEKAVRLVIESSQDRLRFRTSVLLPVGRSFHSIPAARVNLDFGRVGFIRVYPENDVEAHLVFSWLDFVRYAVKGSAVRERDVLKPASQVKCVAWDLDNTLWSGILGEQGIDGITLRDEAVRTIQALDEKGILQTITSKNDHDLAWSALQHFGLSHLLVYPEINWEPKSANLLRIAEKLNISTNSFAFVDDSAFERAEVSARLPEVRTYSDLEIDTLPARPEFEVPVTDESRRRRMFYVVESERSRQALAYGDDYDAFLRTCELRAELFVPVLPQHRERCLELLQRSNQLNLSTGRYSREQFEALLADNEALCVATSCRDRFGDYGLVGFAVLRAAPEKLVLADFVLSCRVAGKKLENAWLNAIRLHAVAAGYSRLQALFVPTDRNHVLLQALLRAGFVRVDEPGVLLEFQCCSTPPASDLVRTSAVGLAELSFLQSDRPLRRLTVNSV